jgi:hypothetical protein
VPQDLFFKQYFIFCIWRGLNLRHLACQESETNAVLGLKGILEM